MSEEYKIKVHIKGLDYEPRDRAATYRAGSVQILDAEEAHELAKAGIAIIVEDPYTPSYPSQAIAYLEQTIVDAVKDLSVGAQEAVEAVVNKILPDGDPVPSVDEVEALEEAEYLKEEKSE